MLEDTTVSQTAVALADFDGADEDGKITLRKTHIQQIVRMSQEVQGLISKSCIGGMRLGGRIGRGFGMMSLGRGSRERGSLERGWRGRLSCVGSLRLYTVWAKEIVVASGKKIEYR